MVIFYRGLHCPVCEIYLNKVVEKTQAFADAGMPIVLVSMDGQDRAETAKADWGLGDLPVAYGLTEEQAREWGLYVSSSIKDSIISRAARRSIFPVPPPGRASTAKTRRGWA